MVKCRVRLKRHGAGKMIAVHKAQKGIAMDQRSIDSTLSSMESESGPLYLSNDTGRSQKMSAFLHCSYGPFS